MDCSTQQATNYLRDCGMPFEAIEEAHHAEKYDGIMARLEGYFGPHSHQPSLQLVARDAVTNLILEAAARNAAWELDAIISDCEEVLGAVHAIDEAIATRDAEGIREGLKTLDDFTDGYWRRLKLGRGADDTHEFLRKIEESTSDAAAETAAA